MRPLALVSLSLALSLTLACRNTPPEDTATVVDLDGDGIPSDVDCNDGDAAVSPTATELCDGIDNNCDGQVDEADGAGAFTWYPDADGDGFGLGAGEVVGCTLPEGYAEQGGDCNDALATSFPGATETCNGVDDDCDGEVDNGVLSTFYADSDADGYGDADSTANACEAPSGYVADATDCDDAAAIANPGAAEICDGVDNNCDAQIDEAVLITYAADQDGDTYADEATLTEACAAPQGFIELAASVGDDCDDQVTSTNPGASEVCNGVDDDCDTVADNGVKLTFYADSDTDGYGDAAMTSDACSAPSGYVSDATDCDDGAASTNPGASEVCNGVDDDCDTVADNGVKLTFYADSDTDGYGDAAMTSDACSAPSGYVSDATDCDDSAIDIFPGAPEVWYDGVDQDCSFTSDDDQDGDGHDAAAHGGDDLDDTDGACWDTCLDGASPTRAMASCAANPFLGLGATTDVYWLDPNGGDSADAFQTWCDMDTDGGGWTLVMRAVDGAFHYDDAVWTTPVLADETVFDLAAAGQSKYASFNTVPFQELRSSGTVDLTVGYAETLAQPYDNALALFLGTGFEIGSFVPYFNSIMNAFSQEWGCTSYRSYGVNQKAYLGTTFISGGSYCDWNGGARWGQRVNAYHSGTGNHAGQGWGTYSTIAYDNQRNITQLLWVR